MILTECLTENYSYGDADSTPQSFEAGGGYDICGDLFA